MSSRWTVDELLCELDADYSRRIVFVEGRRDEKFWSRVVPLNDRGGAVVYTIDNVEIGTGRDGQKGRILELAHRVHGTPYEERICFFVDADHDRLLGREHPPQVVLTDFRDLEAYGHCEVCIRTLCTEQFSLSDQSVAELLDQIGRIGRPIGAARYLSQRLGLDLPFKRAFERDGGRNFTQRSGGKTRILEERRLLSSLLQSSGMQGRLNELERALKAEVEELTAVESRDLVHGKDLLSILSWYFETTREIAEALLFGSMMSNLGMIVGHPNVQRVEGYIRR